MRALTRIDSCTGTWQDFHGSPDVERLGTDDIMPPARDGFLRVRGESAYPLAAAGPRIRVAAFARFLVPHKIHLRFTSALNERDYRVISSSGSPVRKAATLTWGAARLAARPATGDDLLLVHRLRYLLSLPMIDPPSRIDVYDFDDALFAGSILPQNRGFAWAKGEARRWADYVRSARVVIAGNSYLADHARRLTNRVEVIPSCVDPSLLSARRHEDTDTVTLGWIGSSSTARYLESLVPVLMAVRRRQPQARLLVVGGEPSLQAPGIEHRPWSPSQEARALGEIDIGLMPLPDDPWTRGKCGYKLLQYFSAGIPAVASPVGVNTQLIGAGGGYLARSTKEWVEGVLTLAGDAQCRTEMGRAGRGLVEREYSYQQWTPRIAGILRSLG